MKRIITTSALFLVGILISSDLAAQCSAGFTWTQSNANTIAFTNTSSPMNSTTIFIWSFGDQQNSYQTNPSHFYNTPGTFLVCLSMYDSLSNCQASFCDTITVTGNVNCVMTASAQSQFASCATCADGTAGVQTSGGTGPYTYAWSNGGTTQIITNLMPGLYSVCVTDANGCVACDSVNVYYTQSGGCQAYFTSSTPQNGQVNFTNASTGTSGFTTYSWSFGDNGTSFAQNPQHTYSTSGNYIVCLTITVLDSMSGNCTSTYCDTINVLLSGMKELSKSNWNVFPNPAQDQITIQTAEGIHAQEYRVMDITGKEVLSGKLNSANIDIHNLDAGVYILELKNSLNERSVQRFVKN